MRMKLFALAVSAAMLTGSGLARAETTTPTLTPFEAPINAQMETANVGRSQVSTRVALSDNQMQKVTAGHYNYQTGLTYYHWGYFHWWAESRWQTLYGWHRG